MNYFETVKPTYIENWPQSLRDLSIHSEAVPLTLSEARALGASICELGEGFAEVWTEHLAEIVAGIRERVNDAIAKLPGECAFLRLGSRSPKDSYLGYKHGFRVRLGEDNPLRHFQDSSERTADDLRLAIAESYAPTIWAREWLNIAPHQEWRCFMRDRKLVGISQYEYRDRIDWCLQHKDDVKDAIERYFPRFRDACHLDSAVFDIVFPRAHGVTFCETNRIVLLEVNPFFDLTDPCLFSWKHGGDFDGSVRVQEKAKAKRTEGSLLE